jgi:uncharacterized protein DUF1579
MANEQPPKPGPEHKRLDVFVGKWNTEGTILASPSGPTSKLKAVDTYEWLPGGFFLVHHVDGRMGGEEVKAIEIIGYDVTSQKYFTRSFDNQGNTSTYQASLLDGVWTILGDSERFTGLFGAGDSTLTGKWERFEGSEWLPWMDVRLTKVR